MATSEPGASTEHLLKYLIYKTKQPQLELNFSDSGKVKYISKTILFQKKNLLLLIMKILTFNSKTLKHIPSEFK